ncbi:MAG: dihydropteroate synthase, partial [Anaerolineales bacterium]
NHHSVEIILAMGTNKGDRQGNLAAAVQALAPQVIVRRISSVYSTPPWGYTDQPDFLNIVLTATTSLAPEELLTYLKDLEQQVGRTASFRWGPREIDIDILDYGGQEFRSERLVVPHPRMHERAFVLVPLSEIVPDWRHPLTGASVASLLAEMETDEIKIHTRSLKMTRPTGITLKGHKFDWGSQTYVMGILNLTPDSFSGDGLGHSPDPVEAALEQARRFVEAGAHILDVGGESTRPGSDPVGAAEEIERVIPVVKALAAESALPVSIDTYKAEVAAAALDAGADLINDVWGLKADPEMAPLAAARRVPVVMMHNRSTPKSAEVQARLGGRYTGVEYDDLIGDIKRELLESVAIAREAGVPDEHIILDTGIGFGKTVPQNLELLNRTDAFLDLGFPILIGSSRKSFIGYTLDLPPDQRLEGTAATVAVAITRGADIVRVHDVEFMVRLAKMTDAIVR